MLLEGLSFVNAAGFYSVSFGRGIIFGAVLIFLSGNGMAVIRARNIIHNQGENISHVFREVAGRMNLKHLHLCHWLRLALEFFPESALARAVCSISYHAGYHEHRPALRNKRNSFVTLHLASCCGYYNYISGIQAYTPMPTPNKNISYHEAYRSCNRGGPLPLP